MQVASSIDEELFLMEEIDECTLGHCLSRINAFQEHVMLQRGPLGRTSERSWLRTTDFLSELL